MINILKSLAILATAITISSCLVKAIKPSDPCNTKEFANNLSYFSKNEVAELEKLIAKRPDSADYRCGCQAGLLGKLYLAQGRPRQAANSFALAAAKLPELSDYFMLAKAKAEYKSGNYQSAKNIATSLLKAQQSVKFMTRVHQLLADLAVKSQDHQQIIETHKRVLRDAGAENEDRLYKLAFSLSKLGNNKEADEIFKQLLIRYPTSAEAKQAQNLRGKKALKLTLKENEGRFDKLIGKLAFDQVVLDADKAISESGTNNSEASAYNGFAVKSLILSNKFNLGLLRAQKRALSPNATPKDFENYAWSLGKVERLVEAADYYSRFAKSSTDPKEKSKGCFFAGFSLYEASLYSMALFTWQQCKPLMTDSHLLENYLWYQALSSMLINNYPHAHLLLTELMTKFKGENQEKYAYFLGYSLHKQGKKNAGDIVLRQIANKNLPTYYIMLARRFLGLHDPQGREIRADALSQLANKCDKPACQNALTLYHLGFAEEAREMIVNAKLNSDDKLAMLQQIGQYHEVWQRSYLLNAQALIKEGKLDTTYKIRASYPLPHQPIIDDMSRKYSIPKSLLYAIIRAESGFATDAESYRGALGLMQMMPFVATDLASKLDFAEFSSDHLKEPKISLELGTLFLATLKRQFANTHLMVAAYNAGPHQVQRWLNRFGHLPTELFIERIPFEQTRTYVKKVLPSESLYYALRGQPLRLIF